MRRAEKASAVRKKVRECRFCPIFCRHRPTVAAQSVRNFAPTKHDILHRHDIHIPIPMTTHPATAAGTSVTDTSNAAPATAGVHDADTHTAAQPTSTGGAEGATRRHVRIIDLRDDPELIAAYRRAHSRAEHWAEVREGIRQVGIRSMELYISGSRVVMVAETDAGTDWDAALRRLATLPRQAEWEAHVSRFQRCAPHSTSAEKWSDMELMFWLYD